MHSAAEVVVAERVVGADRGTGVAADVAGFVYREDEGHGPFDAAFAVFMAVEEEGDGAALAETAAVVGELDAELVAAGGDRRLAFDVCDLDTGAVVAVFELALVGVEAPAAELTTLGDDDALGAASGTVTSAVTLCDLFLRLMIECSVRLMPG